LLVLVLVRLGDRGALAAAFGRAAPLPVLLAVALNALNLGLKVARTQLIARHRGYRYSVRQAWKAMLPSLYLGMVTPGRVGDALRVQYLRHDLGVPYAEGLAMVVVDRLCDLYVLVGFVVLAAARFASVLTGSLGVVTWLGVAATALLPLVLVVPGPSDALFGALARRMTKDIEGSARFLEAVRALVRPRLVAALPLTVGAFLVNYLQGWLVAEALGLTLRFVDVVHVMAVTSLLGLLPISISGAGVREVFLALVFPSLGLAPEQGVAFGLLVFAAIYLACSLAGLVAWQLAPPPLGADDAVPGAPDETRLASPRNPGEDVAVRRRTTGD
jgi:uncharacterized membrane protein YbhN (UPF0104 family)